MLTEYCFQGKLGQFCLLMEDEFLIGIEYAGSRPNQVREVLARYLDLDGIVPMETPAARAVQDWLERYAAGQERDFALALRLYGTDFQRRVWEELRRVGYGETIPYSELARRVGAVSSRAVGTAVGHNPIPIVVPCHRILRRDGSLGQFSSGDGPETKARLLRIEGALL